MTDPKCVFFLENTKKYLLIQLILLLLWIPKLYQLPPSFPELRWPLIFAIVAPPIEMTIIPHDERRDYQVKTANRYGRVIVSSKIA